MNSETRKIEVVPDEQELLITDKVVTDNGSVVVKATKVTEPNLRYMNVLLPQQVNVYQTPEVTVEQGEGMMLQSMNVVMHIATSQIEDFKAAVADIEVEVIELPSYISVEVAGTFNHAVQVDLSEMLVDNDGLLDSEGNWIGTRDELDDAIRSRLEWSDLDDLNMMDHRLYDMDSVDMEGAEYDESQIEGG